MALRWYETPQDINMEEEPNASKCLHVKLTIYSVRP